MASLLSSFRREKAKIKITRGTGKGREEIYVSKWFAFQSFAFLIDKGKAKETINTENDENSDAEIDPVEELNVPEETESTNDQTASLEKATTSDQNLQDVPNRKRKIFLSPKKSAIKRKSSEDPRISTAYDILKNVPNTPKDESFTYGQHVTAKLKKFNNHVRSVVIHLMNIIFDAEMGKYNNYVHTTNSYNQTNSQYARMPYDPLTSPNNSVHSYQSNLSQDFHNSPDVYVVIPQTSHKAESQLTPLQDYLCSIDENR